MSHLVTSKSLIKDIDCLDAAVKTFGGKLVKDTHFVSYYNSNPCEYKITLPGVAYQIGVIKTAEGYTLQHDPYGTMQDKRHDGPKLIKAFGEGLCLLTNAYNEQCIVKTAKQHGFTVTRKTLPNGDIALKATRMAGVKSHAYQKIGAK